MKKVNLEKYTYLERKSLTPPNHMKTVGYWWRSGLLGELVTVLTAFTLARKEISQNTDQQTGSMLLVLQMVALNTLRTCEENILILTSCYRCKVGA